MLPAPIFWGVFFGGLYFLVMWRLRSRRLAEQRHATRALYALSEGIVAAGTPAALAKQLEGKLPELVGATGAHLYLANRGTKSLVRVETETSPGAYSVSFDESEDALGTALALCFRNRAVLTIADSRKSSLLPNAEDSVPRSLLLVPLVSHEEPLGVLQVHRSDRAGAFEPEKQAATQHVGNQVASALKLQEQQTLREQLFRGEKLAATGHMISGVARELKSPLDTISALSSQLLETLKRREDIPAVEAGLAEVAGEAARAREIVARMLSLTHEDSAAPRQLELTPLLQAITRHREPVWEERGLQGELRFEGGALPVLGSGAQLEQVFLTFLLFVEQRAAATPSRTISVKTSESADQARVEIGYAEPEPVESGSEAAPLENMQGGLSLEVCRSILRTHGGELRIHHRAGVFAFEITVPCVGRVVESVRSAPAQAMRPLTLMLVDAEPGASRPLMKLLNSRGHRVVPVAGEEAAEVAPRLRFDAVFWSARPGRGGWGEFLERVRESVGTFVVVSDGYSQDLAASLEKNGGYLLSRPVEESALDRILMEIDGRARA